MSKIGKLPVTIEEGVSISVTDKKINVSGPKGTLFQIIPEGIEVKVSLDKVVVSQRSNSNKEKDMRSLFGLVRAEIANMIKGVKDGFEKKLELSGVGYRASVTDEGLTLSVGFSHTVKIAAPLGITFDVVENIITVLGIDKSLVGETAAKIRAIRPPEPYKGKGISYQGEKIRRKAGKAAKAIGIK